MMQQNKRNRTKIVIIILAVLLACSLCALAGTVIYNRLASAADAIVTVPDNLITPDDADASDSDAQAAASSDTQSPTQSGSQSSGQTASLAATSSSSAAQSTTPAREAAAIALHNRQPQDNVPFSVGNMFPGDRETKYFNVQVSHHDTATVHFKAEVRPGYEKLAEVMQVHIQLLTTGETLYDGLMRDMPESVTHALYAAEDTTDELYYEITAYLDTSVGNAYQNKDLVADFHWWVAETGNLTPPPKTGDNSAIILWSVVATACAALCVILLVLRKKEEDEQNA